MSHENEDRFEMRRDAIAITISMLVMILGTAAIITTALSVQHDKRYEKKIATDARMNPVAIEGTYKAQDRIR